jgi:transaldolase
MSQLDSLKKFTTVVADTGDLEAMKQYRPQDATTNPSLLSKAAQLPQYRPLVEAALADADRAGASEAKRTEGFMDRLAVNFGKEIAPEDRAGARLDRSRRATEFRSEAAIAKPAS